MDKKEAEKYAINGKVTVVYKGTTDHLFVAGMMFPYGEPTRLSLTKIDRLKKIHLNSLEVVK
jgi:hypothetical protein